MTSVVRVFIIPRKAMMWFVVAVVAALLLQWFITMMVQTWTVRAANATCTITSIDSANDSTIRAKLDCGDGLVDSTESANLIAAHLKSPNKPIVCTLYGGFSSPQCKVPAD